MTKRLHVEERARSPGRKEVRLGATRGRTSLRKQAVKDQFSNEKMQRDTPCAGDRDRALRDKDWGKKTKLSTSRSTADKK